MKIKILMMVVVVSVLFGCSAADEDAQTVNDSSGTKPLSIDQVVAVVNGRDIKAGDIQSILDNRVMDAQMQTGVAPTNKEVEKMRRQLIEQLIIEEIIKQTANNSTIQVSQVELDTKIATIAESYGGMSNFLGFLISKDYTLDEFIGDVTLDSIATKMMAASIGANTTTISAARSYYDKNTKDFFDPAGVIVSHILRKITEEISKEDVEKELNNIKKIIASGNMTFEEAASKYSDCPSRRQGGMIGLIPKDDKDVFPSFKDAAYGTSVSNISDVFYTDLGAHILYVIGKKQAVTSSFEEIKYKLMMALDNLAQRRMVGEWTQDLRNKAEVEYKKLY